MYHKEWFGPIVLVIKTKNTQQSLDRDLAIKHSAISCGAYTPDAELKEQITDEMGLAGTPVSFNLVGNIYLN